LKDNGGLTLRILANVSNPWREAIEVGTLDGLVLGEEFPILGGRLLKAIFTVQIQNKKGFQSLEGGY